MEEVDTDNSSKPSRTELRVAVYRGEVKLSVIQLRRQF
jgi:hypothetical protein